MVHLSVSGCSWKQEKKGVSLTRGPIIWSNNDFHRNRLQKKKSSTKWQPHRTQRFSVTFVVLIRIYCKAWIHETGAIKEHTYFSSGFWQSGQWEVTWELRMGHLKPVLCGIQEEPWSVLVQLLDGFTSACGHWQLLWMGSQMCTHTMGSTEKVLSRKSRN